MTNPALANTTSRGRTYGWGNNQYVSVTTALKNLPGKDEILPRWAAKEVAEGAVAMIQDDPEGFVDRVEVDPIGMAKLLKGLPYAKRDNKADIGSYVHAYIEATILGEPLPDAESQEQAEQSDPYVRAFEAFDKDHNPGFAYTECTVYCEGDGWAGTTDGIVELPKVSESFNLPASSLWTLDWKTSKGVYSEAGVQVIAYGRATFGVKANGVDTFPMPKTVGGVVVHLKPTGQYDLYVVTQEEQGDKLYDYFLKALALGAWRGEGTVLRKFGGRLPTRRVRKVVAE